MVKLPRPQELPSDPVAIAATIASRGFVRLPAMSLHAYRSLASVLGDVVDETRVRLRPETSTYLCQPEAVPMHTDHPDAHYIAWRCEVEDADGCPQLLCDGRMILAALDPAVVDALGEARLPARYRAGLQATECPVVSWRAGAPCLFFAPWVEPVSTGGMDAQALRRLRDAVQSHAAAYAERVLLRAGEVLIIDNSRMLHGRPALSPGSRRCLHRLWIGRTLGALSVG